MKSTPSLTKKILLGISLVVVTGLLGLATAVADHPLSKDDLTLLLLGSSPSGKIIEMINQRGIDFQMNPDLAKKFHDLGASDDVIDALQKAGSKPAAGDEVKPNAPLPPGAAPPEPAAVTKPNAPTAPAALPPEPAPESKPDAPSPSVASAPAASSPESSSEPTLHVRKSATMSEAPAPGAPATPSARPASPQPTADAKPPTSPPANPATASGSGLKDPSDAEVQHIIQEFTAKEKIFREARNNYTYHQINKVQELGPDNEVVGTYEQEWDILFDDKGGRIERVTYAPQDTLKNLIVTEEDLNNFRNIQPFVLTTDELPEYEVKYLGHVQVDKITAYVFKIRPKQIEKNRLYFDGVVWVDDRDLQIVKSEGKTVPELKGKRGQNLFPRFTTWREQIDGKFWFPTFTMADDTLYFPNAPAVHMKEIIRYTDYKQFKSAVRITGVEEIDKSKGTANPPPPNPNK
jgi:hypothetical protein